MATTLLNIDAPLFDRLINSCETRRQMREAGHESANQADELLRDREQMCQLVNSLFWASLYRDEGRTAQGSVCICAKSEAPRSRSLAKSVRLTPKSLTQLFIASPSNTLAVHLEDGVPQVWGFLDSVPMFTLQFHIPALATVVVSEHKGMIAVIEKEQVFLPEAANEFDLTLIISKAFELTHKFPERLALAARIRSVALAMHRHGHGGTLVITPPNSTGPELPDIQIAYKFDESGIFAVRSALDELETAQSRLEAEESNPTSTPYVSQFHGLLALSADAHLQMLKTTLKNVGELSRIDGAVVLDSDLKVLGFGAKLSGSQEQFCVMTIDALTKSSETVPLASLGGTRHQSAARYVHRNRESLVIVASQDGRLTVFAWVIDPGEVLAIRRLEHFTYVS